MSQPLPTSSQALEYFVKFRQLREKNLNGPSNRPQAPMQRAASTNVMVTQVDQSNAQRQQEDVLNRVVPVNVSVGTYEERLERLRLSPTNTSPNLPNTNVWSLLPMPSVKGAGRVTLVLDVDETLVHSSFSPKEDVRYDLQLNIQHEGKTCPVFVKFRPHLMEFLKFVAARFEVVIFTASLPVYCNALMDYLDPSGHLGPHRLFREHCTCHTIPGSEGKSYVKDLCLLGRDLGKIAIVDNSPNAYLYQQRNAIPISSFFQDESDTALLSLLPLLEKLAEAEMVYDVLDSFNASGGTIIR